MVTVNCEELRNLTDNLHAFARKGYRTLAFAYKRMDKDPKWGERLEKIEIKEAESDL
jgi:magnesium-transporting ATPase (P-type)